jgi:hypothetical protein
VALGNGPAVLLQASRDRRRQDVRQQVRDPLIRLVENRRLAVQNLRLAGQLAVWVTPGYPASGRRKNPNWGAVNVFTQSVLAFDHSYWYAKAVPSWFVPVDPSVNVTS